MKKLLKKANKFHVCMAIIMVSIVIILLYLATMKAGMHVDEYYSYGLANHEDNGDIYIMPECGVRLSAAEVFDEYFYADNFSIRNVWVNQSYDVHPPMYYLIFHVFGLLTHNVWGLKTGILLNILFHILSMGMIYLILKKLINKDFVAVLGSAFYGITPIVLGNVLFIRMYVLCSLVILALEYLLINEWQRDEKNKLFYLKLGIVSVFGTLTHYYFLLFLFWSCVVWGIKTLAERKWKELLWFIGTMAFSGCACICIFPAMLKHIFWGYRGKESFDSLFYSSFLDNLKAFLRTLDEVCGGFLLVFVIIAVYLFISESAQKKGKVREFLKSSWMIVSGPGLMYTVTLSKIAISTQSRYVSPVYAMYVILIIGLLYTITSGIINNKNRYILLICVIGILLNGSYKSYDWPELHLEAEQFVNTARKYGVNNECIYVFNRIWRGMQSYQEFIQYQNLTFIPDDNLELLYTGEYDGYDHVVMYFDKNVGQEKIDEILQRMIERNPEISRYEKLHEYSYNVTYYLE